MSLIRVRRKRKQDWIDARKGMPVGKLLALLALVAGLMWYLGRF
jgi:hypothetical protein